MLGVMASEPGWRLRRGEPWVRGQAVQNSLNHRSAGRIARALRDEMMIFAQEDSQPEHDERIVDHVVLAHQANVSPIHEAESPPKMSAEYCRTRQGHAALMRR